MNNIILLWGAPFVGLGARASILVPRRPGIPLFLILFALVSAWVGVCILLICVYAGVVVVDIYNVVDILVHCC